MREKKTRSHSDPFHTGGQAELKKKKIPPAVVDSKIEDSKDIPSFELYKPGKKRRFFSDLTLERWRRFRQIKRSYWSLWILGTAFFLSLLSPIMVNDKPLLLKYEGRIYFPAFRFYAEETFGGKYKTEANYLRLVNSENFRRDGHWALMPPIPHAPVHSYIDLEGRPPHPPSWRHWLGTDESARDVFARLIHGFRICMLFSLILTITVNVLGIVIGGIQGYLGGKVDIFTQRVIEIWSALPFLYVVILISSVYGRGFALLIFVLSLFRWYGLSLYMRAEFFRVKNLTYIKASKSLGLSNTRIFFHEILPNAMVPVITFMPFYIITGIGSLTALDFLGFGLQPPTPSWGEMLSQGLRNLYAPWLTGFTVAALFFTLLLTAFIGEGIREAFDPKGEHS